MYKRKPLLLGSFFSAILLSGIIIYVIVGVFFRRTLPYLTTSSVPYSTPTPYPTTDPNLPWKIYLNNEAGFSLSYPANWIKEEPSDNRPDFGRIPLNAAEGSLDIEWTTEPTVADSPCPQGKIFGGTEIVGEEPIQIKGETVTGCHFVNKTGFKENTWRITKLASPNKVFLIFVEVKEPLQRNKDLIFKVLSTLKLGE